MFWLIITVNGIRTGVLITEKKKLYKKLCEEKKEFYFVFTVEDDIFNLKNKLGKKLKETSLGQVRWKFIGVIIDIIDL